MEVIVFPQIADHYSSDVRLYGNVINMVHRNTFTYRIVKKKCFNKIVKYILYKYIY